MSMPHRIKRKQMKTSCECWVRETRRSSHKLKTIQDLSQKKKPGSSSRVAVWSEISCQGRVRGSHPAKAMGELAKVSSLGQERRRQGRGFLASPSLGFQGRHPELLSF